MVLESRAPAPPTPQRGWKAAVKRAVDLAAVAALAPVAAPLALATAASVRLSMGSPVIFAQPRPGYLGRTFTAYQLRTMRAATAEGGRRLTDAEGLTPPGPARRRP